MGGGGSCSLEKRHTPFTSSSLPTYFPTSLPPIHPRHLILGDRQDALPHHVYVLCVCGLCVSCSKCYIRPLIKNQGSGVVCSSASHPFSLPPHHTTTCLTPSHVTSLIALPSSPSLFSSPLPFPFYLFPL